MTISAITRRNIIDTLRVEGISWHGRLAEHAFVSRVWNLPTDTLGPDGRFELDFRFLIHTNRIQNQWWPDDWVFEDQTLDLVGGTDGTFLEFVCQVVHPIVRSDVNEVNYLVATFNDYLAEDGWELVQRRLVGGRPLYVAQELPSAMTGEVMQVVAADVNSDYISRQIARMQENLVDDPELVIGTAKEFVETVCKTILTERHVPFGSADELTSLIRLTARALKVTPDDIAESAKGAETVRRILHNLGAVAQGLAELRNRYGTGHGKEAGSMSLRARHARLAFGSASTLGVFLFETHRNSEAGAE